MLCTVVIVYLLLDTLAGNVSGNRKDAGDVGGTWENAFVESTGR